MDRIGLKRLNRKRALERRRKCHGNVFACQREHPPKGKIFAPAPQRLVPEKRQRVAWWERMLKWLRIWK